MAYHISIEQEVPKVPIPYRLRLSDANKLVQEKRYQNEVSKRQVSMPCNSEITEEKWDMFYGEFLDAEDVYSGNICEKFGESKKSVWIHALNMFVAPAQAAVFEKYWGKIQLGKRTFNIDPAPHIPRCCHFKAMFSPVDKNQIMIKNALEVNERMRKLREKFRNQEAKEVSEATKRLEEFKKTIRENAAKSRNQEKESLKKIKQITEDRINSIRNEKTKNIILSPKNPVIPRKTRDLPKSPSLPKVPQIQRKTPLTKKIVNVVAVIEDVPEMETFISDFGEYDENGINDELRRLEEAEAALDESRESSPELLPVELPDWVRDFLERKRKAGKMNSNQNMPIPVLVANEEEEEKENGLAVSEAEISESLNTIARQLDFTAHIMEKKTPHPFGMASREIPDLCVTASSQQDPFHRSNQARLNNEHSGKNAGAWCPKIHNNNQWLQIDLQKIRNVQQIATQGMPMSSVKRPKDRRWVESFALSYSENGESWKYYEEESGNPKVFIGNADLVNTAKCSLMNGLQTRYIRFHPISWNNGIALRVEVYGEREKQEEATDPEDAILLPREDTALQRYASETEPEPVDFDTSDDDDDGDSGSDYVFQEDDEDELSDEEKQAIDESKENDAIGLTQASEVSPICNEAHFVPEDMPDDVDNAIDENDNYVEQIQETEIVDQQQNEAAEMEEKRLLKEAEERKRLLKEEAERKFTEEMARQERSDKRKLRLQKAVEKLTRRGSKSTGLVLSQTEEKVEDDFLSMYCILKESQKILYTRIFDQFKNDEGRIEMPTVVNALRVLNLNILKESEMKYITKIISVFETSRDNSLDQKAFNVIAAFSDRLKNVDGITRGFIRATNFETLYLHAHKTRVLFEQLLEGNERTISLEQFLIELEAGGVDDSKRKIVTLNMKDRKYLDFLDFVLYYPLILFTHDNIMTAPL